MKSILDELRWQPPAEDPDEKFKLEARRLQADANYELLAGGPASGGELRFRKVPTWEELKADHAKREAEEKERREGPLREAAAFAEVAKSDANIAKLERELKSAESRAKVQRVTELAQKHAREEGRAMTPDDRSWAARKIAKLEGLKKEVGE